MAAKLTELTLIYRHERIRFDQETAILVCEDPAQSEAISAEVIVKADCEPEELVPGLSYRFFGRWKDDEKYGRQFHAKSCSRCQPHGKEGVIRYLVTTCKGCGIGPATAAALYDEFGSDAVRMLREQPEVAAAAVNLGHFTRSKAFRAAEVLQSEMTFENVNIDLCELLRGFPRNTAKRAIEEWGIKAAEIIRQWPYDLRRFPGCGFSRTDQLYLDMGGDPAAMGRQAICACHFMERDRDGHIWFRPEVVEGWLQRSISGASVDAFAALQLAKQNQTLAVRHDGDGAWVAEIRKAENEQTIARRIREILLSPNRWPGLDGLNISGHQRGETEKAMAGPFGQLVGSPGTGKTHVLVQVASILAALTGPDSIAVSAFMGKAASRIGEVLAAAQLPILATTTHRLLGVASHSAGDGFGFAHNENNPLRYQWYLLDEASTYDVDLFAAFLRAVPEGGHVLIFGDTNQLPSIGHGAVLRDLIAAGVPTGELREIRRNSGAIVEACTAIRDGRSFKFCRELDPDIGDNLVLEQCDDNEASLAAIVRTLHKLPGVGIDPIWDAQVLVSVNDGSPLARKTINRKLQAELNPDGDRVAGCPFRVGDKIIRVRKNSMMPVADSLDFEENRDAINGKVLVCNGEMGRVVQVEAKRAFARFTGPKRAIVIPFGTDGEEEGDGEETSSTGCDFDLGFGVTIHKAQGSEWPVVLVGLDNSVRAMRIGSRELFYTGISRGKQFVKCFGKEYTARAMCMRRVLTRRKTFLKELLLEGIQ